MEVERAQHPKHIVPGKMKLSEYWAKLRLNPKFDTDEDFRGYYISTFVPGLLLQICIVVYCLQGMKKEDIRITVDKNGSVLTIEGLRLPTKEGINMIFYSDVRERLCVCVFLFWLL